MDDNLVSERDKRDLLDWSSATKESKLSSITDPIARSLVHQLLSREPSHQQDASHVLSHPFITGNKSICRLPGQLATYSAFISYRVDADKDTAESLYDGLTRSHITADLDIKCLPLAQDWEKEFVKGLVSSDGFVPVISRDAINSLIKVWQNFSKLKADSSCDNVLLEYRMAIKLRERGMIAWICPLFIGDEDALAGPGAPAVTKYTFRDDPTAGLTVCHPDLSGSPVVE